VRGLYIDFLHREGDLSNPNDAGGWVAQLNAGKLTTMQVASEIVHSTEALGIVVDGLYARLLNRSADTVGRAGLLSFLQNGGTVEQAIARIASSPEFAGLTNGSDAAFVKALYTDLLGRSASDGEVADRVSELPTLGRLGVANAILNSDEYRTDEVEQLYGNGVARASADKPMGQSSPVISLYPGLLGRDGFVKPDPSAADVSAMVNSGQDILALEAVFAGSPEYLSNVTKDALVLYRQGV
jgi:hypothetical protein